jgi:hypothetical protein
MKIVIYSCNFGNYRNEFKNYYDMNFDENIDYFLFTDTLLTQPELDNLKRWTVCNMAILPSDEIMDGNRWTSKHAKFILPEKLKHYDIIIWIDSKMIKYKNTTKNMTYEHITELLNTNSTCAIFNIKHNYRTTAQEELLVTIPSRQENTAAAYYFLDFLGDYVSKFDLPDTCVIIRKNELDVNNALEYCFELMTTHKLKRDQNIYNFALDTKNITPILLDYNLIIYKNR